MLGTPETLWPCPALPLAADLMSERPVNSRP